MIKVILISGINKVLSTKKKNNWIQPKCFKEFYNAFPVIDES